MATPTDGPFPDFYRKYIPGAVRDRFISLHLNKQSKLLDPEINQKIGHFGSALLNTINDRQTSNEHNFLGIYCRNSIEWAIAMFACSSHRFVYVPIYDTLGREAVVSILEQTNVAPPPPSHSTLIQAGLEIILCYSPKEVRSILQSSKHKIHTVILVSGREELPALKKEAGESITIHMFDEFMSHEPDDLCTICYTSGSTVLSRSIFKSVTLQHVDDLGPNTSGLPKGVTITHRQYALTILQLHCLLEDKYMCKTTTHYSYLPLAHVMEQLFLLATITAGGRIAFNTGGIDTILADIQASRPTILAVAPRVLTKIYRKVMEKVDRRFIRNLADHVVKTKLKHQERYIYRSEDSFMDKMIFRKVRDAYGGRVSLIVCGSAPLRPEMNQFFRAVFGCPLIEGYGCTETTGVFSVNLTGETQSGTVGSIFPRIEVKLVNDGSLDLPENCRGGEIFVRGPTCTKGYYKNDQQTVQLLTQDGWLRTGDIGEWTEKGALKIVGRYKSQFKLAQGEYVVPDKVENVYSCSHLINQVLLEGDSNEAYAVAIVCPDFDALRVKMKLGGDKPSDEDLCSSDQAKCLVLKELDSLAAKAGLNRFERARAIHLTTELMTVENGLLTSTFKVARYKAHVHFASIVEQLYKQSSIE